MVNNIQILKNITILYAEDEKDLRDVTSQILESFTKKQYIAQNGKEGLELFKEHQNEIDLIITDINMPVLNGLDMIKEIKKINLSIPIIVATAFSNKEYLLEAIDIGVDKYVLKPIDVSKLLQVMSQSLLYHELKELYMDNLTNIANRNKLKKDLDANFVELMALLDIDNFSTINELFGEQNGDALLCALANKLKDYFNSEQYSVYRIEADKFAIVTNHENQDINHFFELCKEFIKDIEKGTLDVNGNEIDINITMGIAHGNGSNAFKYSQRIINYARSKFKKVMIYNESLKIQKSFETNIEWVKKLKFGLKNNLFQTFFQAIVDTKTQEIFKYEALIRYIDQDGKEHGPFEFLDIAKSTKIYPEIIKIVLKDSLNLVKEKNIKVSLNISYEDIINNDTVEYILKTLEENKQYSNMIDFEILESEEIADFDIIDDFIKKIKVYGCHFGIDDFGSGYSNFNLLTMLDISFVKIDGSLIKNIKDSTQLEVIVKTIASITKELQIKTVAEFVADEGIYEKIKNLKIDYSQGYYFGKPLAYDKLP